MRHILKFIQEKELILQVSCIGGKAKEYGTMIETLYTFLTRKGGLLIMKATAISLFFVFFSLFFLSGVSALDFDFSSPSEVSFNQEFQVTITASQDGKIYDVKIYIHNSS